jgi:hypothetical protein
MIAPTFNFSIRSRAWNESDRHSCLGHLAGLCYQRFFERLGPGGMFPCGTGHGHMGSLQILSSSFRGHMALYSPTSLCICNHIVCTDISDYRPALLFTGIFSDRHIQVFSSWRHKSRRWSYIRFSARGTGSQHTSVARHHQTYACEIEITAGEVVRRPPLHYVRKRAGIRLGR